MNHVYRLIWREAAGGFVAVAEMARACGARTASKAAVVSSALLLVAGAQAAGSGFNVVDGSATLATNGSTSTVTQTSHGVRIDWQTLGVAAGETLKFVQPSASAVALNVIKGGVATEILGQLQANGNVFILNPNGVLVKAGAQVSVGGFLGSTNDLVSFNPTTGALVLQANNSTGEVNNAGSIVATQGGMVALVGNKVINSGTIVAPGGGIYLLAGDRVEFTPADGSPFTYSLTTDTTRAKSVSNTSKGSLSAAGGAIVMDARSTKQAVVNSRGVISAGSVSQGPDGSIRLTALGGKGEITNTGKLSAGKAGGISAQLDTGGRLVHAVGDPNNGGSSPVIDQWLSAQDKTYDGNTDANVSVNLLAFGQSDFFIDFTLTQASFTSRNANEQATVTIAGKLVQPDGGQVLLPKSLTAAIHLAELTVTSSDVSKTYDGTTSALGSAVVLSGLVQGDSVAGGSFAFTNKNAGTGKTVTVDGVTVSDGNNGGNYKVTYVDNTTSNIDQAQLTITSSDVIKTYDGTTSAAGSAVASGLVKGDSVSGGSFAFTNKNAGTGKTVTVGDVTVDDGNNGGNYKVTYVDNTTSNIDQAQLTITSSDVSKTYDGTTSAAGSAVASGLMQGDSVSGGAFAFTNKNAGTGKTVTVDGVTVSDGNNGGNYKVTYVDNTSSNIDQAQLTITSSDVSKTYDGTTSAAGSAVASGLMQGDSVSGGAFAFTNKNAGSGKTVTVDGVTVSDGNNGGNYKVTYVDNTSSNIDQAQLTITSSDVSKTYDGTTSAAGSAVASGLMQGDSVSGGAFAFTNKNAGSGKTVTVDGVTVSDGNNGGNYKVTYVDNTTSNIDRAQLTLSAVSDTKSFDSTTSSTGAPQVSGLVANDSVASLSQAFDSSAVGARTLNVNGYVLNDGNNGNNYEVTLVTASGAITNPPPPNPPTNTPDLGSVINNGGNVPTQLNVDLAGLGDLLAQLPPTAAGEEDDPEKIKARRRSDRSPLRVTDGGVNTPPTLR